LNAKSISIEDFIKGFTESPIGGDFFWQCCLCDSNVVYRHCDASKWESPLPLQVPHANKDNGCSHYLCHEHWNQITSPTESCEVYCYSKPFRGEWKFDKTLSEVESDDNVGHVLYCGTDKEALRDEIIDNRTLCILERDIALSLINHCPAYFSHAEFPGARASRDVVMNNPMRFMVCMEYDKSTANRCPICRADWPDMVSSHRENEFTICTWLNSLHDLKIHLEKTKTHTFTH
jgi:hypothetical protein